MANWYGAARTNYVKINDLDGLKTALAPFPLDIVKSEFGFGEGVALLSTEQDSGGWPCSTLDGNGKTIELDPVTHICPFMAPNQVLVIQEIGSEKMRYLTGWAAAYTSAGERLDLNLDLIYKMAAEHFNIPLDSITTATY